MARHQHVPESPKSSAYRRSSHKSSRRRKEEETIAAKPLSEVPQDQPNVEQLRRARQGYYAQSAQDRQRRQEDIESSSTHDVRPVATTSTAASAAAAPVKVKKSVSRRTTTKADEHGRKRRKHRSSTRASNSEKVNRRSRLDKQIEERREESGYVYSSVREETAGDSNEVDRRERELSADDRMGSVLSTRRSSRERNEGRRSVSPRVAPPDIIRTSSTRSRKSHHTSDASLKKPKSKRSSGVSHSSPRAKDAHGRRDSQPAVSRQEPTTRVARESLARDRRQSHTRPQLKRNTTQKESTRSTRRISEPTPVASSSIAGKTSASKARERRKTAGLFGSIFASKPQAPEKKVECLTCLSDDVPASKAAKLACGHRMCHACLRRIFTMSVTDPQHMPPRCCTQDSIALKHVDRLFNDKFKILWNRKYQEYTTKNRIYCPARGCGEWIKPSNIHMDSSAGRKYGKCSRCRMKVCCLCNGKWHLRKECPKDEETKRFVEIAKEAGWQRCYNCKAMVELKEGCNHMTCRCTAEFCMLCGNVWKTCDCPWFNYTMITDQLNGMNVPEPIRAMLRHHEAHAADGERQQRQRQRNRRTPANAYHNVNPRNPALTYQQEMDRRRAQERADEDLARRLQQQTFNDDDDDNVNDNNNAHGEAAAAAAARIYIHNYHRYRARRERAGRVGDGTDNGGNGNARNRDHTYVQENTNAANANHPDATVQMQEVAGAAANILLGTAMNGLRTTAEAAATTAPRPTTGTTARRAEMRRATAAALARSTASVDMQMDEEGSQRRGHRQRRREGQRRRDGRAQRVRDNEPTVTGGMETRTGTGTAVMAGLANNGRGHGVANRDASSGRDSGRVGAWLQHVQRDEDDDEEKDEEYDDDDDDDEQPSVVPGAWAITAPRTALVH